ncbi:hypothetical protein M8C13_02475 [Crossiella sp. SN42]|uniref:hypothetical protein n=1 Tax=Crossiella sp. SN42 TaxID=2944808 RepID=UPI00207CFD9F|nr:hypothetical protein [Crossiella sp. SN42]MCO1574623.1 hypothetical protein [Crossiella sp. SN42]
MLAPEVLAEYARTDLLRLGLAEDVGGPEVDPMTIVLAIAAVAEGDASAAWYAAVSSANSVFSHYLGEHAAREVFAGTAPVGSSGLPQGSGELTDDGLIVHSGQWPWGSAGAVASWMGFGMVVDGRMLLGFVPAGQFSVVDNWDAHGMRATASGDFTVHPGTLVPAHRLLDTSAWRPRTGAALSRFPVTVHAALGFAATALGNAAGAVADYLALAGPGSSGPELAVVELARAEARLHAARAFLLEAVAELWDEAVAGRAPAREQRARARLALAHATAEATAVVDAVYPLGGGAVVRRDNPLQRRLRDAHVITQQVQVSSRIYPLYGRIRLGLGLEPSGWQLAI